MVLEQSESASGDLVDTNVIFKAILSIDTELVPHTAPTSTLLIAPEVIDEIMNLEDAGEATGSAAFSEESDLVDDNQ